MADEQDNQTPTSDDQELADLQARGQTNQDIGYAKPGSYQTDLGDDEPKFQQWVKDNNVEFDQTWPPDQSQQDYDMRGYYKAQQEGDPTAKQTLDPNDGKMHFPDQWKTPYHETFSGNSQYATENAPHWEGDKLVSQEGIPTFNDAKPDNLYAPSSDFQYDFPDSVPAHDNMTMARLAGYTWDEIHSFMDGAADTAKSVYGYAQHEIDSFLGYNNPQPAKDTITADTQIALADRETDNPMPPLDEKIGKDYATALLAGQVKGPEDYGNMYAATIMQSDIGIANNPEGFDFKSPMGGVLAEAGKKVASTLPSNEQVTDSAIALVNQAGHELNPENINIARENVLSRWSDMGVAPADSVKQAKEDTDLLDNLTNPRPKAAPPSNEPSLYKSAGEVWNGKEWVDGPGSFSRIKDAIIVGGAYPWEDMSRLDPKDFGLDEKAWEHTSPGASPEALKKLGFVAAVGVESAIKGVMSVMLGGTAGGLAVGQEILSHTIGTPNLKSTGAIVGSPDDIHPPIVQPPTQIGQPEQPGQQPQPAYPPGTEVMEPAFDPVEFAVKAAEVTSVIMPEVFPEAVGARSMKAAVPSHILPEGLPHEINDPAVKEIIQEKHPYIAEKLGIGKTPKSDVSIEDITIDGESGPPLRTTMTPEEQAAAKVISNQQDFLNAQKEMDEHVDSLAAQSIGEHFGGRGVLGSMYDLLWDEQGSAPRKMTFRESYDALSDADRETFDKIETEHIELQYKDNRTNADGLRMLDLSEQMKAMLEGRKENPEAAPPAPTNMSAKDQVAAIKANPNAVAPMSRRERRQSEAMRRDEEAQAEMLRKTEEAEANKQAAQVKGQARHEENVGSEHIVEQREEQEWGQPYQVPYKELYRDLSVEDKARIDALDKEHQEIMAKQDSGGIPAFISGARKSELKAKGFSDAEIREMKPEEAHEILRPQDEAVISDGQRIREIEAERDKILGEKLAQRRLDTEEKMRQAKEESDKLESEHDYNTRRNENIEKGVEVEKNREQRASDREFAQQKSAADLIEDEKGKVRTKENFEEKYQQLSDESKKIIDDLTQRHNEIMSKDTMTKAEGQELLDIHDKIKNLLGDVEPEREAGEFTKRAEAIKKDEEDREGIIRKTNQKEDADDAKRAELEQQRKAAFDFASREGRPGWLQRLTTGPWRTAEQRAQAYANRFYAEDLSARLRAARGLTRQEMTQANFRMQEYRGAIKPLIGEYRKWIRQAHNDPEGASANPAKLQTFIDHVEGVDGVHLDEKDPLFKLADQLREEYMKMRSEIETHFPDFTQIFDDYYRHLWTRPDRMNPMFLGRQGSSASLKDRSWMTIREGIFRGATPAVLDPIDNLLHYMQGMKDFLDGHKIMKDARDEGIVYYGSGPAHMNDIALRGRAGQIAGGNGKVLQAFAPAGWAKTYNRFYGRGFYDWGKDQGINIGDYYAKLQYASSMATGMKLSFSGFHAMNIAQETIVAGLSKALGHFAQAEFLRGGGELLMSGTVVPKLISQWAKGKRIQQIYKGAITNATPTERAIIQNLVKANAQFIGRGQEYFVGRPMDNIAQAWKRGTLLSEWGEGLANIAGYKDEALLTRLVGSPFRATGFFIHEVGRLLNTVMAPLFDHAIPHLKIASSFDEMALWMRRHTDAAPEAQVRMARKISDNIDDRFGELQQDNLKWPRVVKQIFNALTVSVGWEYGTLRAFGGAAKDLIHGDVLSPRARWMISFPAIYAAENAIYQHLKTDQWPWETDTPYQDMLVGARTGGKTAQGFKERARLPSVAKDVYTAYFNFGPAIASGDPLNVLRAGTTWSLEKGNPLVQITREALGQRDSFAREVPPGWDQFQADTLENLGAISPWQKMLFGKPVPHAKGSKITDFESIMGIAAEGRNFTDRVGVAKAIAFHDAQVTQSTAKRQLKAEQALQQPDPEKLKALQAKINKANSDMGKSGTRAGAPIGIDTVSPSRGLDFGEQPRGIPAADTSGSVFGGGSTRADPNVDEPSSGRRSTRMRTESTDDISGGESSPRSERSGYTRTGGRTYYDRTGSSSEEGGVVLRGPSESGREVARQAREQQSRDDGIVVRGNNSDNEPSSSSRAGSTKSRSGGRSSGRSSSRSSGRRGGARRART